MNVLLVHKFWRRFGGVEEHVFQVRDALETAGHTAIPFAMAHPDNLPSLYSTYFPSQVDFHVPALSERWRAANRAVLGRESVRNLRHLMSAHHIDAAYVVSPYHHLGTAILPVLSAANVPVILSMHDYKISCPNYSLFNDRTLNRCRICLDRPSAAYWAPAATRCSKSSAIAGAVLSVEHLAARVRNAYTTSVSRVVVVNELQRKAALQAGVPPDRIHLVAHYAPPVELDGASARGTHGLFVGRLVPEKGVRLLLQAADLSSVPVVIVGDGPERHSLERLARTLETNMTFVGAQRPAEVASHMRTARFLAVPSLGEEVFGLVIAEAFARRLPVVASATGGIPDLLSDGRGVLVPPGDVAALAAVLRAIRDDAIDLEAMSNSAADFAATRLTKRRWLSDMATVFRHAGVELCSGS